MDNGLLWRRHIYQLLEVSKPHGAPTEPGVPTTSKSSIPEHLPPAVSAIPEEPTDVTPTVPEVETSESHGNTENKQETQTACPPARRIRLVYVNATLNTLEPFILSGEECDVFVCT